MANHHVKHFVWFISLVSLNKCESWILLYLHTDEKTEAQRLRDLLKPQT